MSRNIGATLCSFCGEAVELEERARPITAEEARGYFDEYEGMLVANAHCPWCFAKYLAWMSDPPKHSPYLAHLVAPGTVCDLSYRSTFDDEPGEEDRPTRDWAVRSKPSDWKPGPWKVIGLWFWLRERLRKWWLP